jgi:hypothetical protein
VRSYARGATLRIEPLDGGLLFTLDCRHGCSEALTPNPDDSEVLVYLVRYYTACEGCDAARTFFPRLRRDA